VRLYEATFVADPNLTEADVDAFIQQMEKVVEGKNAKCIKVDRWGKRTLAFQVGKFREGHVVIMSIEGHGEAILELERRFKVTDFIIRYLTVRVDADLKRQEKLKAKRSIKLARRAKTLTNNQPSDLGPSDRQIPPMLEV
jgi:small subunit ribosomal protein S6